MDEDARKRLMAAMTGLAVGLGKDKKEKGATAETTGAAAP